MERIFKKMADALMHLNTLHEVFNDAVSIKPEDERDKELYRVNAKNLNEILDSLGFDAQIYARRGRQMILADFLEYIFFGRGYYSIKNKADKELFIKAILRFVNLLMSYEATTASTSLRKEYLEKLAERIPQIENEQYYTELRDFEGTVGFAKADATDPLNKYFDSLLPKTAGGLWHELLVYIFLLRNNCGYIVSLLLSQRFLSLKDHIVPPDFLVITEDKRMYGIEVGTKKEIQSGSFSLKTAIPTATIDTINSRSSDRCPICKRWIQFCDYVIENYSDLDQELGRRSEVRCLSECTIYSREQIVTGQCPHTKYSRENRSTLKHTHHDFADKRHYHYSCVLGQISEDMRHTLIEAEDEIGLKTHYPYYAGLEVLIGKEKNNGS